MATRRRQPLDQLRTLRAEFDALRSEVQSLSRSNGHASGAVLQAASRAAQRLRTLGNATKDHATTAGRSAEQLITAHPFIAIGTAAILGAVAMRIAREAQRRQQTRARFGRWQPFHA